MMRMIVLLLTFIYVQDQVDGVYVRIQAINANRGRTGGGERVVAFSNNRASMSQYHSSGEGRSQQEWEMVEIPRNKTVHLYLRGDADTRQTMLDTDGNFFDVGLDNTNGDDPKQQFMFQHQKIYCNAGQHYFDGRLYSLQYQGNGDTGSPVVCGPSHDTDEEEMNFVSTEDVQIDGNEFFIVNKVYPHAKLAQWGTRYKDRGTKEGPYSPDKMWRLEKGPGSHNHYYIKNVKYQGYRLAQYGTGYWDFSVYGGPYFNDQLWRFEKVTDNLGDQWDYYRIWNKKRKNYRLAKYGTGDKDVSVFSGSLYNDQLWRLVPRYEAQDEGYIPIRRHTGQPTDITEVVTYTKGLRLTRGTSISSKIGFSTSVQLAVGKGPFSASVASTISAELSIINTASAESSWSVQRTTTRVFPANQDCTLYQRRVKYLSDIQTDELTQTPADFKMVCKPLKKVTRLMRLLNAIEKE